MNSFTLRNIPNLDVCVLAALELFTAVTLPKIKIPYKRPLVVGSGNAAATGRILFANRDAVFADESTINEKLKIKTIDGIVLISASGGKHAPIIAKKAKGKPITLITNNKHAKAIKYVTKSYIFPKNREPYTYNTSTYIGMILGHTKEDPKIIKNFIEKKVAKLNFPNFKNYDKFFFIVPEEFSEIKRLLQVKFIELFGRKIARDVETFPYMKHAVTVVPSKELFISFGKPFKTFSRNHLTIPLPKNANYATMMAIGYYVVGQIQKAHPAWFKKNIDRYCKEISKIFRHKINPIVE